MLKKSQNSRCFSCCWEHKRNKHREYPVYMFNAFTTNHKVYKSHTMFGFFRVKYDFWLLKTQFSILKKILENQSYACNCIKKPHLIFIDFNFGLIVVKYVQFIGILGSYFSWALWGDLFHTAKSTFYD